MRVFDDSSLSKEKRIARLKKKGRIHILFTNWADQDNFNAQSLNAREIALRLNPQKYVSTLFYARDPDPRLIGPSHIRLIKIPPRLGTLRVLGESIRGYDILFKPTLDRFGDWYFRIPPFVRKSTVAIEWVEADIAIHLRDASDGTKRIFNSIYHKMDLYVATTEYVAERAARDYGIQASSVICTGVNPQLFMPPAERSSSRFQVLFVGSLIQRKGPEICLEAAARFSEVNFVLVGERRGRFGDTLLGMVERKRLENVKILPPMPQVRLARIMGESHVFLHPSLVDSPGKAIMEAAATGLPAIIFSHYRSPAVKDGMTGFQVGNVGEMMERLDLLLKDSSLRTRMGKAAVEYMRQYDWDLITREWQNVFERAFSRLGPGEFSAN